MNESQRQIDALEAYAGEQVYGLQWGDPEVDAWLRPVLDWIYPQLGPEKVVVEIGCGGGRWSRYFQHVKLAYLVDATPKAEALIRQHCTCSSFFYLLSSDGHLPEISDGSVDYVFTFDVFVHFERGLFDAYLKEIARVMKPNGVLHLHHAIDIGSEHNPECFKYRDPLEIDDTLKGLGFQMSSRRMFFRGGYGSTLVECFRDVK